nr:unnamed protein product [Callosobruchus analis]
MDSCNKCGTSTAISAKNPFSCEFCGIVLCKGCSQLCPTEVKVIELTKRVMIFACEDCRQDVKKYRNNPIGQLQNQIDKLEETVNKLQVESKDMLNTLTEKMMQANAEIIKMFGTQTKLFKEHGKIIPGDDKRPSSSKEQSSNVVSQEQKKQSFSDAIREVRPRQKGIQSSIVHEQQRLAEKYIYIENEPHTSQPSHKPLAPKHVLKKQVSFTQSVSSEKNHTAEGHEEFTEVTYTKKKKHITGRMGIGEVKADEDFGFTGKDRKIWIFLRRVKDSVAADNVSNYLVHKLKAEAKDIEIKKVNPYHRKPDNGCFLVGLDPRYQREVFEQDFWPRGVFYDRFDFKRGDHFLDNHRRRSYISDNAESQQEFLTPSKN